MDVVDAGYLKCSDFLLLPVFVHFAFKYRQNYTHLYRCLRCYSEKGRSPIADELVFSLYTCIVAIQCWLYPVHLSVCLFRAYDLFELEKP